MSAEMPEFVMPVDNEGNPDFGPVIEGPLAMWRAVHPEAQVANVSERKDLTDADFVHFVGIKALCMKECNQRTITTAAFAHLRGIHTLDMSDCDQPAISNAAFAHLRGIKTLHMRGCDQTTITDEAFAHLVGIRKLDMSFCNQSAITDAAFVHLRGIYFLNMYACNQATITDAAFANLARIYHLDMGDGNEDTITDAAFAHLRGIHTLVMNRCNQKAITDAAFAHLRGMHTLDMSDCNQRTITDAAFAHLTGIQTLKIIGCNQDTITDAAFAHLHGINTLHMWDCTQPTITDAAFVHLAGIHTLDMSNCNQLTDAAFEHLRGIRTLYMRNCSQSAISDSAFAHLHGIHTLNMKMCTQPTITDEAFVHLAGISCLDISGTQFTQRLFAGQHLLGAKLDGLDQASVPTKWLLPSALPLSLDALSDPSALKILQGTAAIAPALPLSPALTQFLLSSLNTAFAVLQRRGQGAAGGAVEVAPQPAPAAAAERVASHWWCQFIDTCGERVCTEILAPIFANPPLPLRLLADAKDNGRTANSIAKPNCRALFDKYLLFCGRYELLPSDPREHSSPTCRVLFARDISLTADASDEPALVALKLMRHQEHFQREVSMRSSFSFSSEHVVGFVRTHTPTDDPTLAASLSSLGSADLLDFKHVVVLPAGDKVCSAIIDSESQKANWPEMTRTIAHALASSLAHMHEKGVIHGDVKPRNIVRCGGDYLLIDLDAAVPVDAPVSGKVSTAFAAPELLAHMHRTASAAAVEPLLARPSLDMWSLGVTLCLMLRKAHLFSITTTDNLDRAEDSARLAAWTPQEHAAAVSSIEDRAARALVFDLLHCDPLKRPSAQQVLQHPFITRKPFTSRLGGEAPAFDVFLSYRVASEGLIKKGGSGLVKLLYDALTARGLRVFVDFVALKDGKNWREGFCAGAAASRVFVPLLSSAALASWSTLTPSSFTPDTLDNVLLEHRLAVELQHRGYLSHIFPVFVGECTPVTPAFPIAAIETELVEQLRTAGLSLPFTPPQPVADIWRVVVRERQGEFFKPSQDPTPQLQDIAQRIWGMCQAAAAAEAAPPPPVFTSTSGASAVQLQAEVARLQAELQAGAQQLARAQKELAMAKQCCTVA